MNDKRDRGDWNIIDEELDSRMPPKRKEMDWGPVIIYGGYGLLVLLYLIFMR